MSLYTPSIVLTLARKQVIAILKCLFTPTFRGVGVHFLYTDFCMGLVATTRGAVYCWPRILFTGVYLDPLVLGGLEIWGGFRGPGTESHASGSRGEAPVAIANPSVVCVCNVVRLP